MLPSVPPPVRRALMRASEPGVFPWLYAIYCLVWALYVGTEFFASLEHQLFLSQARAGTLGGPRPWSAPLDDVFIHFDFARSAARGFPLQWSEGNGYSSGGTSLLYPFVLALGYRIGYDQLDLMLWAGVVATISVWYLLRAVGGVLQPFPRPYALLVPPVLLSVGALNWSLWSGMEVAFFLAIWGACLLTWDYTCRATDGRSSVRRGALLGLMCLLLVATRPESAPVVACFVLSAVACTWRHASPVQRLSLLLVGSLPGAMVVGLQALANRIFTGDTSAAGALVKLEAYHPYLTSEDVWAAWRFHFEYQVLRVTDYHLSDISLALGDVDVSLGWLVWLLAAVPLAFKPTRRVALLLWLSALAWLCTVSFNGQVRWQNERYTMPAVAWLLCSTAIGLCVLIHQGLAGVRAVRAKGRVGAGQSLRARVSSQSMILLTVAVLGWALHWVGQAPRYRDQLWFFGRASRNIFDQHVQTGYLLKNSPAQRVLVGDAGAIPYVSDLPAVDIIGLGGLQGYPFARATRMGVPAALELLERLPAAQRPNVMALYPGWWSDLPLWFGEPLFEVPVRGNVICGGASKVVYASNWQLFTGSGNPHHKTRREIVSEVVDFADLTSEEAHGVAFDKAVGYVAMKVLPHTNPRGKDLWDAGRVLPEGASTTFMLQPRNVHEPLSLVLRVAPAHSMTLRVTAGSTVETLQLSATDVWLEPRVTLSAAEVKTSVPIKIEAVEGELILYHVWGLQDR